MGAQGSPGDVHEGQRRIELEAGDCARPRAGSELGPEGIAGHDHAGSGKAPGPVRKRDRDAAREPGADPVREPRHGGLLVQDDRHAQQRSAEHHWERDEAAGAEDDAGPKGSQHAQGAQRARRNVHDEVSHILPRPVAPELSGGDRDVRNAAPGHVLGFDPGVRADPRARSRTLTQEGRHRETWARVAPRATPRDDDVYWA